MCTTVNGNSHAQYPSLSPMAKNLVKSTLLIGVPLLPIVGIGYGLEKAGEKLADLGKARFNQPLENVGNGCKLFGDHVQVLGKLAFIALTSPVHNATLDMVRWVSAGGIQRNARVANDRVFTPAARFARDYTSKGVDKVKSASKWVFNRIINPFYKYVAATSMHVKNELKKSYTWTDSRNYVSQHWVVPSTYAKEAMQDIGAAVRDTKHVLYCGI